MLSTPSRLRRPRLYLEALEKAATTAVVVFAATFSAGAAGVDVNLKAQAVVAGLAALYAAAKSLGATKLPWTDETSGSVLPVGVPVKSSPRPPARR